MPEKDLRKILAAEAAHRGTNKNTWESYVKGVFDCAAKLATNLPDLMVAISDMDEDAACAEIEATYGSLCVFTGGHMRDWAKQEGFAPYDADRVARERKAAQDAKRIADGAAGLAMFKASNGRDSSTISDMATAPAPVDATAALLASIGAISNMADATAALTAINAKLAELQALADKAPAPTTAPVLADDVTPHPLSALGRVSAKRAA